MPSSARTLRLRLLARYKATHCRSSGTRKSFKAIAQTSPGVLGAWRRRLVSEAGGNATPCRRALRDWWVSVAPCFTHMGHARNRPKRLAEKLLQIREALGLSQKEMAERLGNYRTHHHISKYERGKSVPPLEVVLAYSRLANVSMDQIVDDDQNLCFQKASLECAVCLFTT